MLGTITALRQRFPALFRLAREFNNYRANVAGVLILGPCISAVQPLAVRISQQIIDDLRGGVPTESFHRFSLWLVGLFAVSGLAKFFHNTLRRYLSERIVLKLRAKLFDRYLHMPQEALDHKRTGDLLSTIQNDLAQVAAGIDTVCDIFKEPLTFVGLVGVAVYYDWRLALITLIAAPVVVALFAISGAAVKRYSAENLEQYADLMSLGEQGVTGSRIVKVFRLEQPLLDSFRRIQDDYFRSLWRSIRVQEIGTPAVEFIGAILMAGIIVYGGYRVSSGALTAGDLIAFLLALGLAQMPIKKMNNAWLRLRIAEAASERIYSILDDSRPTTPERPVRHPPASWRADVRYEGVHLTYDGKPALDGVSFGVQEGECVAIVGHSGSGKSSLVNLLPRLYEAQKGRVLLGGIDTRDLALGDLRSRISAVTQDVFLFNDTVYQNILYGRPSATRREVERAAEQAHCAEFIAKLPRGFEAKVGDRGVRLSGGERQRLAIARAILRGAPVLILDEATSSLDSESERVVQDALDELMEGKTSLLVAHRFSSLRRADRIVVLDNGKVREAGTHEELMARRGLFTALFESQMGKTS